MGEPRIDPGERMTESGPPATGLPIDPITLAKGLVRRWYVVVVSFLLAAGLGTVLAIWFGAQTYSAHTVLLFKPRVFTDLEGNYVTPPLPTQVHVVKVREGVEEVRRRLGLSASVQALSGGIQVHVEKGTDLMTIAATWSSAQRAADIANTMRDVFLERQRDAFRAEVRRQVRDIETRLGTVEEQLRGAEESFEAFILNNEVIDLEKEAQWYLEELMQTHLLLDQARIERSTVDLQSQNIDRIIAELKSRVAQERAAAAQVEAMEDTAIRAQRLRESIADDQMQRGNEAYLVELEDNLRRMEELYEIGLASDAELTAARARYERQKAHTVDTDQVSAWKDQLAELDAAVIPDQGVSAPSGRMLENMMSRAFEIQLQRVSVDERVEHLEDAIARVKSRLSGLPKLLRDHVALQRDVESQEVEKKMLEKALVEVRRVHDSESSDFVVLSVAIPPISPTSSTRKIIFLAAIVLGSGVGFSVAMVLVLSDRTFRSSSDLAARTRLPVLGSLPAVHPSISLFPADGLVVRLDELKVMARSVGREVPRSRMPLLLVSAEAGAGVTSIAAHLAHRWALTRKSIVVVDVAGCVRRGDMASSDLVGDGWRTPGLSQYLRGDVNDLESIVRRSILPGVDCVPAGVESLDPDLMASRRLESLFAELIGRYDVVIVDGPPVGDFVDVDALAGLVGSVLFVVRSGRSRGGHVKSALARLRGSGARLAGVVLNDVESYYTPGIRLPRSTSEPVLPDATRVVRPEVESRCSVPDVGL